MPLTPRGEAHAEVMAESIRRLMTEGGTPDAKLRLDAMKLSHHGSTNALTKELLSVMSWRLRGWNARENRNEKDRFV